MPEPYIVAHNESASVMAVGDGVRERVLTNRYRGVLDDVRELAAQDDELLVADNASVGGRESGGLQLAVLD